MNYREAMDYIGRVNRAGSIFGLERIRNLLAALGNPQERLSVIHVAGTNGKGSFGAYLGSILQAAGYRTGRYISPAVFGYRERIQVNGAWIDEASVAALLTELQSVCERMRGQTGEYPTAFEIETAMAFLYFERQRVDFVILEAGLGGQHDATNVVEHPLLSVITSVSLDHMAQLGGTLEKITANKAGIIKTGRPALIYDQQAPVMEIVSRFCRERRSSLYRTDVGRLSVRARSLEGQFFDYKDFENLHTRMPATYQLQNAAAAVEAAGILSREGAAIERRHIYEGIEEAFWPGRFEVLREHPLVIVDGAHNPDGAARLGESIDIYLRGRRIVYLAGIFADKDYRRILEALSPWSDTIVTHKPPTDRGLPSKALAEAARPFYKNVFARGDAASGLDLAVKLAGENGAVVAFGSLSTIADIWTRVNSRKNCI